MTAEPRLGRRRLRAPEQSGEALFQPPLSGAADLIGENQRRLLGQSELTGIRAEARQQFVAAARQYTAQYRDLPAPRQADAPLILAGHQPELFHGGVWLKNFVLSSLAIRQRGVGVNLVVDNDTCRSCSIRVPAGSAGTPAVENVAWDRAVDEVPFEERTLQDRRLFESFADRVAQCAGPWNERPLVRKLWPLAVDASRRCSSLGQVLAQGRHALEATWGQQTLEIPVSRMCAQAGFHRFVAMLLRRSGELLRHYNAALHDYRRINRIRSRSHPVPDLATQDDWVEVPLWIWTAADPRRRRLFVREATDGFELTDRGSLRFRVNAAAEDKAIDQLAELERRAVKIRPRALVTTMYSRLVLSDLFLHGIGGSKYDELTDEIIRRFFAIEPPSFLTVTATVRLPIDHPAVSPEDVRCVQQQLRELRFHPERFLKDDCGAELVQRKRDLLQNVPPRGQRKSWHQALTAVNQSLQPLVEALRAALQQRAAQLADQYRVARLLGSREFSFVLFPDNFLPPMLLDLAAGSA